MRRYSFNSRKKLNHINSAKSINLTPAKILKSMLQTCLAPDVFTPRPIKKPAATATFFAGFLAFGGKSKGKLKI